MGSRLARRVEPQDKIARDTGADVSGTSHQSRAVGIAIIAIRQPLFALREDHRPAGDGHRRAEHNAGSASAFVATQPQRY